MPPAASTDTPTQLEEKPLTATEMLKQLYGGRWPKKRRSRSQEAEKKARQRARWTEAKRLEQQFKRAQNKARARLKAGKLEQLDDSKPGPKPSTEERR